MKSYISTNKLLLPTLFSTVGNEETAIGFLQDILDIPIKSVYFKTPYQRDELINS
ncbi:hypothetical protein HYO62_04565 [Aerococcaceae bacterium DSM 111022]|nr:hypothetical protein [Aerococcaceae bacterium DSM 111022]